MNASHCRRLSQGQAATEFAMVLVPLLLFLFGIVQMSRALYSYSFVSNAARDATRYASVNGSKSQSPVAGSDVTTFVKNESNAIDTSQLTVNTTWSPNNDPGSTVNVAVTYNFALSIPFFGQVTLPLSSTSQMVISQ